MPDANEVLLREASNYELLQEFRTRSTMCAVLVIKNCEVKGDGARQGDEMVVSRTPGLTKQGAIGFLESALSYLKNDPNAP
jgi:hypothetical protein